MDLYPLASETSASTNSAMTTTKHYYNKNMIKLLRKLFIKNYNNTNVQKVRVKHGILAASVGIVTNTILFVFKLLVGIFSFSVSIITEAINNLSDMSSCVVNIVGFKLSEKPADKKHPFGHQRIEYIAGLIIALFIVASAALMGYQSIMKIINNEGSNLSWWSIGVLTFGIVLKIWQALFYRKMAKIINSSSLKASSQDAINDVFATTAVLIATIIEFVWPNIRLDGYMGVAASLFIIVMGIKMVIETSNPLVGMGLDTQLINQIRETILSYKEVKGVHDILGHSYGPTRIYVTAHVEIDARTDALHSHSLIDKIEREIKSKYNAELLLHIDPVVLDDEKTIEIRQKVLELLKNYNSQITFHDFQIENNDQEKVISFDIVLPFELKIDEADLTKYVQTKIKEFLPSYQILIVIDREEVETNNTH